MVIGLCAGAGEPTRAEAEPRLLSSARDDRAVVSTVREKLQRSHYLCLRRLDCQCEQGVVTLRGQVPGYYLLQVLQAIIDQVAGISQVMNLVEVVPPRR